MTDRPPRARKRFGQHFLEPAWASRLAAAIAPNAADTFVEVGPGRGVLTRALASTVARLICVEIDRDLASRLSASLPSHVEIVTADFLEVDVRALPGTIDGPARVAGNHP